MRATTRAAEQATHHADIAETDKFVTAVLTASRALVAVSARSLAEVEDSVTLTQFRTLVVLDSHHEINLNRLADLIQVSSSSAMRMVDRLVSAGLVFRCDNPTNRREVLLGLTPTGRRTVRRATARRRTEITRIVRAIPPGQRGTLIDALRAFAAAADEPEPRPEHTTVLDW